MTALVELYRTDHRSLLTYLRRTYGIEAGYAFANPHRLRREAIAQRLRLYRDDGRLEMERLIDRVFDQFDTRQQRKKMIDVACELNVTARINDEVASLYNQPAVRILRDRNDEFREHSIEIELDELMQEAHRLTWLCNDLMLWQQTSTVPGRRPKLVIVTSDTFDAIPHPKDKLEAAGFILDMAPCTISEGSDRTRLPHYEIWDDTYRYLVNGNGDLVDESGQLTDKPIEHGLGRIPGTLFHRRKPVDRILDDRHGRDITSAHLGVALISVMVMQLSKSQGERQPVLKGNLANVAKNQSMNGEGPIALPPEVEAFMLDTRTDPEHYLSAKKDKLTSVGLRWGLSYEQLTYTDGGDSGKAWQLRRQKLTELRTEQRPRAFVHERGTVELMGYDPRGLRVDHKEQALPQDAKEEIELLREMMKLGLDSVVSYVQRKNPDLTREEAIAFIKRNLADFATLVTWQRALNMPSDADAANPGRSPEENGAQGGAAKGGGQDADNDSRSQPDQGGDRNNPASGETTRYRATGNTTAEAGAAA